LDTSIASISSSGELLGKTPGAARIAVATGLGGASHLSSEAVVDVVSPNSKQLILRESWDAAIDPTKWYVFGSGRPIIVQTRLGRGFFNGGNGTYASGAFSAQSFDLRSGLTLETDVSTPVTGEQWQSLTVGLTTELTDKKISRWNRAGPLPTKAGGATCAISYPAGREGSAYGDSLSVQAGRHARQFQATPSLRRGEWTRVRIQLRRDGRCGFIVGDQLVWLSDPIISDSSARIVLFGNSVGSALLVGRVTLHRGIY